MFNPLKNDDEAAERQLIRHIVRRASAPNQSSPGNAAGVTGGFTNLVAAPPQPTTDPYPPGIYPDEIGVDADGNYWKPFEWGLDTFDDPNAYINTGYPTIDYGR
jgi:hypothetical protein